MTRLGELGRGAGQGALNVAVAVAVMLLSWAIAALVARLARSVLRALRFDDGVRRLMGPRAAARHEPASVAAWAVYWIMMAGAALLALETLRFSLAGSVAARLGEVVPRIVTSAVLFAVGVLIAMLLGSITRRFLESADIRAAKLQGQIVSAVLTGFAAGGDGNSLFVLQGAADRQEQAAAETAATRFFVSETDLSQRPRGRVFSRAIRPCLRTMEPAADEPCPGPASGLRVES